MKINKIRIIRFFFLIFSILAIKTGVAQVVTINLSILPPYSPFYHDYAGFNHDYLNTNNTIVTLTSAENTQVYLTASITKDDNSIGIRVKDSYRPGLPINLMANIPQVLTGIQLKNVYGNGNTNDLVLTGISTREIMYNQALPEGNYIVCFQVRNYATGVVVAEDCKNIYVAYYEPPQIIYPNDQSTIVATYPQFVLTSWTPVTPGLTGTIYRLRIVKMLPGVSATDALKYSTQVILDKSNIITTNFILDLASGIILDTASSYAMQVTASSSTAYFKNNGESEPVVFYYKANNFQIPGSNGITLNFINPNATKNYIETNNETPFLINWNWFDINNTIDTINIDENAYKNFGVTKYVVKIENAGTQKKNVKPLKAFSFTKEITLDSNKLLHYLSLSQKKADSNGFVNSNWYTATVTAYNEQSNFVATAKSVDFQYRKIPDLEPAVSISVDAAIRYMFKDSIGTYYNATNTPVEIDVLRKTSGSSPIIPSIIIGNKSYVKIAQKTGTSDAMGAFHDQVSVPLAQITGDSIFLRIQLPDKYYIDDDFPVFGIRPTDKDTSLNFGQLIAQTYAYSLKLYVRKAYTSYKLSDEDGKLTVTLADSIFNSDAYEYEYSSEYGGSMTYAVESKKLATGITMVIYRKNKQTYIPPVEGNLADYSHTSGYVEVGRGVTQIEKTPAGDVTFVKFDRLLASIFSGDEYYILALNGSNAPQNQGANNGIELNNVINNYENPNQSAAADQNVYQNYQGVTLQNNLTVSQQNQLFLNTPYMNMVYFEDGFLAHEMPFKLSLPLNVNSDDSLYRHVTADYDIVSTKPPTSLVKGRILYHWKSDKNNQLRPLANSTFKIVVDYLVDGKPIGSIRSMSGGGGGYTFSEKFFVPENEDIYSEGMELLDHNATMAVGKTDAQGNFEIEVVNINQKGSLGKGYVVDKGWHYTIPTEVEADPFGFGIDDLINPGMDDFLWGGDDYGYTGSFGIDNTNNLNNGVQNMINGNSGIGFNSSNSAFEVGFGGQNFGNGGIFTPGMEMNGPANNYFILDKSVPKDADLVNFERVYRVIPDNQYIYPSKETFSVQAFEALNVTEAQTCFVKEIKLRVHSTDMANNNLDQMLVTVFRSISDKTTDLPIGEGNGEYKFAELVSPQYNTTGEPFDVSRAQNLNTGAGVFTTKFEQLWPATPDSANGWVGFTTLLAGYEDYYVESCSDPTGTRTYKATFASVKTEIDNYDPDYWLGIASPPTVSLTLKLQPLPSRALIRLIDNSTQKSISGVQGGRVKIKKDGSSYTHTSFVDGDGYVEFLANKYPLNNFSSPVKFEGSATGYKSIPGNTLAKFTFNATGSQFFYNYLLDPALRMTGRIVNMDKAGKPGVPSYIKVNGGKVIETYSNGYFSDLPVPAVAGTKVFIIPKDVGFFDSVYIVKSADIVKSIVDIQDFGVYRRRHRVRFTITNSHNAAIANATIQLGDSVKKTNSLGKATFNFENVSVNNYTFVIRGPEGQNYIPKTLNLKNEESHDFVNVSVKLVTGSIVQGKVTLDGNPVKNAKVYIDVSQQNTFIPPLFNTGNLTPDANLVVAYSDALGNYKLRGIPVNNQSVNLHATLDTSFTVNGDLKLVQISNLSGTANFSLTSFKTMLVNNIYGFPLSVEKIIPVTPDSSEIKVTGLVHWSKAISNFQVNEVNQIMRIENVTYKAALINGKKVGVPQETSVAIEGISDLKFKYLNKYNVKLKAVQPGGMYNPLNPQALYVSKENDLGVIRGKIAIVDNSFNYPSTYLNFSSALNSFYLAEKVNETSVNTTISAVTSAMTETQTNNEYYQDYTAYMNVIQNYINGYQNQPKPLYYLSNASGNAIQFKLIEFDASAIPTKSFVDEEGKIHLNVKLQCHITNAQPENFSLIIDDMVLDNNKVYPATSTSPITLALEKWNLTVKSWSFSTEQGGIVSNNGMVNTAAIDIPFKKFVLRHDLFLMDSFQLQSLKMAGGSIALQNINAQNAAIVFDNKTGTDMLPHWRFSLSGNPAASLPPLKDLSGTIKLNYIQILSNNESVFQLQQQSTPYIIRSNPLAKYSPESIFNGPDYISISGALNVGAPRVGDIALRLKYINANNLSLESVQADFEGKGFVHFVARDPGNNNPNITITSSQISILGNVVEKPVKTFNEIPSTFYAVQSGFPFYNGTNPVYQVAMDKNFVTQLNKENNLPSNVGHKLNIENGGMSVSGGDWSILTYEGKMTSNEPGSDTKPLFVKYAVLGDISADASGMSITNISTPFGAMKMVFDFAKKRMIGTISVDKIPLGTSKLTGTVETLFDPDGFYVAGGCSAEIQLPNPYVDGTYNMGFMLGSYTITNQLWDVVNSFKNPAVKNDCYRISNPELSGFYFTIDRVIIDKSIGFDFILASGYVQANALIGADVYSNFSPLVIGVEAHAYAHVAAGLGSITGTSISGSLDALGAIKFIFKDNKFNADGSLDLGFSAEISQSLIATTISKSFDINCHAAGGTSGFSFSLGSGDSKVDCIK